MQANFNFAIHVNRSIINSLQKLAGKPFQKLNVVFIPTAANAEEGDKQWLINDLEKSRLLFDDEYEELGPKGESSAKTAKLVDFVIRPHLNSDWFPKIRLENLSKIAKELPMTMYAIDDQTAIVFNSGKVEVTSEGKWKKFN